MTAHDGGVGRNDDADAREPAPRFQPAPAHRHEGREEPRVALERSPDVERVEHAQVEDRDGRENERDRAAQAQAAQQEEQEDVRHPQRRELEEGVPLERMSIPVARRRRREIGERVVDLAERQHGGGSAAREARRIEREAPVLQRQEQLLLLRRREPLVVHPQRQLAPEGHHTADEDERQDEQQRDPRQGPRPGTVARALRSLGLHGRVP